METQVPKLNRALLRENHFYARQNFTCTREGGAGGACACACLCARARACVRACVQINQTDNGETRGLREGGGFYDSCQPPIAIAD